jgi:hypothetical protein
MKCNRPIYEFGADRILRISKKCTEFVNFLALARVPLDLAVGAGAASSFRPPAPPPTKAADSRVQVLASHHSLLRNLVFHFVGLRFRFDLGFLAEICGA